MLSRPVTLFQLLGFKVQVDLSWLFLVVLVVWSLAEGFFPAEFEGLAAATYWWMAVAGALGLFGCLVLHELAHSLVARRHGLQIKGITLFIFGGVAQMEEEPPNARSELLMAAAGPLASVALAAGFYGVYALGETRGLSTAAQGVVRYLAYINGLLAAFNLIPAFPLDGGRILRAGLWWWRGDLRSATRSASRIGAAFGTALIALGLLSVITAGNLVGGMWLSLIGLFVRGAAGESYRQVLARQLFGGEPVRRFMTPSPVVVGPNIRIQELVDEYIYRHHHDLFPVIDGSRLLGCIGTAQVKPLPRAEWSERTVRELLSPCSPENTIDAGADAVRALALMRRSGNSRLLVIEGERLVGVLALKDMLKLLALKLDLEGA